MNFNPFKVELRNFLVFTFCAQTYLMTFLDQYSKKPSDEFTTPPQEKGLPMMVVYTKQYPNFRQSKSKGLIKISSYEIIYNEKD
jgi:hypothetical protein